MADGLVARCGKRAMAASAPYREGIPVCPDRTTLIPNPVGYRC
ncbi:MAG TPA: hypothetical protein VJT49_07115 [Amycolatopsis sp.]|nr:hypothetical protein [Amycolatopsis sp.]